jgi:hypothetical protein
MQKKRRNGHASTKTSVEDEIAHLRGLDLKGLRSRWQSIFGRAAPAHLTRHLLFAVIAYRLQADRFGDLDHATRQVLDRTVAKEAGPAMSARLANFDQKRTELTPGTVLVSTDRMEPAVRGTRTQSGIASAPAKIPTCGTANPSTHGFKWAAQTSTSKLVAGTEFLDAETERPKSSPKRLSGL